MDFIFGYGSIINDISRNGTLKLNNDSSSSRTTTHRNQYSQFDGGNYCGDEALAITVSSQFAKRCWNFRCPTGFTALGLVLQPNYDEIATSNNIMFGENDINGIVFPITTAQQLRSFDLREVGYNRVCIPLKYIKVETSYGCDMARIRAQNLEDKITKFVQNQQIIEDNFYGLGRMFSESDDEESRESFSQDVNDSKLTTSSSSPNEAVEIRIWVYVPEQTHIAFPNEDYPILQTYLDICLRGCIQWGGKDLAKQFLKSTHHWSECFLYDTPVSRRPWIHRPDHLLLDQCLEECAEFVKYELRKHPEEYASFHQTAFKQGQWGLSNKNPLFTGREDYIQILHSKLTQYDTVSSNIKQMTSLQQPSTHFVINEVQIIGYGGVGKSELSIAYAHRYLKTYYHFVAFIRAESFATLSSDLRKLALDLNILNQKKKKMHQQSSLSSTLTNNSNSTLDRDQQELIEENDVEAETETQAQADDEISLDDATIAEEIRKRLSRCRFRWLLIFDNVDDPSVLSLCVPRGVEGVGCGHIIVTSRISHPDWTTRGTVLNLHCFDRNDSRSYLKSALPQSFLHESDLILDNLASSLGHLPLALTTAAIYMSHCDVHPEEYLRRLDSNMFSSSDENNNGSDISRPRSGSEILHSQDALTNCFGMTLDRIEFDYPCAVSVLPCLGFLASDVTKEMIHHLLCCCHFKIIGPQEQQLITSLPVLPRIYSSRSHGTLYVTFPNICYFAGFCLGLPVVIHILFPFSWYSFSLNEFHILLIGIVYGIVVSNLLFLLGIYLLIGNCSNSPCLSQLSLQISMSDRSPTTSSSLTSTSSSSTSSSSSSSTNPLHNTTTIQDLKQIESSVRLDAESFMKETDTLWQSFRKFSLISLVRDTTTSSTFVAATSNRIGTIHRLQQSVLRVRAKRSPRVKTLCLERCIWLLDTLWKFTPHDSSTWNSSSDLIEHIQILTKHITEIFPHSSATPSLARPSNAADCGLSSGNLLTLSRLLTNASQYTAIVLSKHDDSEKLLHLSLTVVSFIRESLNSCSNPTLKEQISHEMLSTQATCLHMLGKVCRYNGKLVESERYLKKSLEMNKNILSSVTKSIQLSQCHRDELRIVLQNLSLVDLIRENQQCDFTEILTGLDKIFNFNSNATADRQTPAGCSKIQSFMLIQSRLGDTLHELGVLFLRTHHLQLSKSYLLSSLRIQFNPCMTTTTGVDSLSMNMASSLYQLGVIQTIEQKYDSAQKFLDYSLKLMRYLNRTAHNHASSSSSSSSDHCSNSGLTLLSEAAIYQQIGKILFRKGNLLEAKENMFHALQIYHEVYGVTTSNYPTKSNLNIACIHHQLGAIYTALRDHHSACEHLMKSLQIRETMLLEYKSGHILDYVISLQAIGKAEIENRGVDVAFAYLLRAKILIEDELKEFSSNQRTNDSTVLMYRTPSASTAFVGIEVDMSDVTNECDVGVDEISSSTPSFSITSSYCDMLTRQLESCLHSLKKITKLQQDYSQFQDYAKQLKELTKKQTNNFKSAIDVTQNYQQNLLQTMTLPAKTTLKLLESPSTTGGTEGRVRAQVREGANEVENIVVEEINWNTTFIQYLERLLSLRSDIREMSLQTLKRLKQMQSLSQSTSSPSGESFTEEIKNKIELIQQQVTQLEEFFRLEKYSSDVGMERIGIEFIHNIKTILEHENWNEMRADGSLELKPQLMTLLGHCDEIRTQLRLRGLVLEDQK